MNFQDHFNGAITSFFHLCRLHSSPKIDTLQPLYVLLTFITLMPWIQVTLVALGWLPGNIKENFPLLFGFVFVSFMEGLIVYFNTWSIVLLIHSLGINIGVVCVGLFWVLGVVIHVGWWWHNLAWIVQHIFSDNIYNRVLCHRTGHWSNKHP